jgi:hypothetical protein
MYTVKIDISDWSAENETITVETSDFDKIRIIQEFIEFQREYGWCVDYEVVMPDEKEEEEEEEEEVEEDEQTSDLNVAVFVFDSKKQIDEE